MGAEAYADPRGPEEQIEVAKMRKPLRAALVLLDGPRCYATMAYYAT